MLEWIHLFLLSIVQGITEFLPISSTAHLILFSRFFNGIDQGLLLDVSMHFGSLGAVCGYFYKDVKRLFQEGFSFITFSWDQEKNGFLKESLFLKLVVATIPVVIVGFLVSQLVPESWLRQVAVIGVASILFGLLLYAADKRCPQTKEFSAFTYKHAFWAGCAQVIALIPGASRSGMCMLSLRAMGFSRTETAHFSCLMSIPVIIAASTLMTYKLFQLNSVALNLDAVVAAALSFVISLLSIAFMMNWVKRANFSLFVWYRVLLGCALLVYAYF